MPLDIEKIPSFLRLESKPYISFEETLKMGTPGKAAHIMLWCRNQSYNAPANVMMHLRFDGLFGFPGGLIDYGEDAVKALNRELAEEIGWNASKTCVTWDDYFCSRRDKSRNYVFHFFLKEISPNMYTKLEKSCLKASEYGSEVLGTIRVPLDYSLCTFLGHRFASECQILLLLGLLHIGTHKEEELKMALESRFLTP